MALGELDYVLKVVEDESLSTNIDSMPNVDLSTVYALKDCLGKLEGSLIEFEKTIKVSTGTLNKHAVPIGYSDFRYSGRAAYSDLIPMDLRDCINSRAVYIATSIPLTGASRYIH